MALQIWYSNDSYPADISLLLILICCSLELIRPFAHLTEGTATRWSQIMQVMLNKGLDFFSLDDTLVDMKLSTEVLNLPTPAYFRDERAEVKQT